MSLHYPIRRDAEVMRMMTDISAADGFPFPGQDLLNSTFKGQTLHLDHSWNCLWGLSRRMAQIARAILPHTPDQHPIPAKIVHFAGLTKPWEPLGSWCLGMSGARMLPAIYRYRMAERRLEKFLGEGDFTAR